MSNHAQTNWERKADAAYRISLLTTAQRRALGQEWLNWCEVEGIDPLAELTGLQRLRIAWAELFEAICDALPFYQPKNLRSVRHENLSSFVAEPPPPETEPDRRSATAGDSREDAGITDRA